MTSTKQDRQSCNCFIEQPTLPKITTDTRWKWLRRFRINCTRLKIVLQSWKLKRRPIEREPNEPSNGCTRFTSRSKIDFFGRVRIAAARTVRRQGPPATRRRELDRSAKIVGKEIAF